MAFGMVIFRNSFSLYASGDKLGLLPWEIGLLFSSMGVFQVIFRLLIFDKLRNKLGDTLTVIVGLGNYIISYFLLALAIDFTSMMFILFYISIGGTLSRGIITSFASRVVDFKNQGKIMGVTTSIDNMSQIFGPIIGISILALDPLGFILAATLSVMSVVPFLMSFRFKKFGFEEKTEPKFPIKSIE